MKFFSIVLVGVAIAALLWIPRAIAAMTTLTVPLSAQSGSGETGTAKLTDGDGGVTVVISLSGAPATAQPAHIHTGTCADLGGVAYGLESVVNGSSTTTVKGTTVAALMAGAYAINVHESAANIGKYVACGNIVSHPGM